MPVNLSIRNAPDEMVTIIAGGADGDPRGGRGASRRLRPDEVLARVQELGLSTPSEATAMIREDRDER
jgi:hypothetical protein